MAIITVDKNGVERSSLVWIQKNKQYGRSTGTDVMISIARGGTNAKDRVVLHFYNSCVDSITSTGYLVFAVDGDCLYMAEAELRTGFKASKPNPTKAVCAITDDGLLNWAQNRRGNYQLYRDSKSGLYYIEAKELKV